MLQPDAIDGSAFGTATPDTCSITSGFTRLRLGALAGETPESCPTTHDSPPGKAATTHPSIGEITFR